MEIRHLLRVSTGAVVAGSSCLHHRRRQCSGVTLVQPQRYESDSTYVVRVTSGVGEDVLNALGVLGRQTDIAETYAQIGASRTLRQQAAEDLGLTPGAAE